MVVKRKTTLEFKGRLCARGDLWRPDIPLGYSAPTVSRCSPRFPIALSVAMKFSIGILDLSSAFTQSDLIGRTQSCLSVAPWYAPMPRNGVSDVNADRRDVATHYFLTLRPLYGTPSAPLRRFPTISTMFKKNRLQLKCDPCVFRLNSGPSIIAPVCLRVDDLLCGETKEGWLSFMDVVDCFNHSGVERLRGQNLCYLGLDMGMGDNCVFLGKQTNIDSKLIPATK